MDQSSAHQQGPIFNRFVTGLNPSPALTCCRYCSKKNERLKERSSAGVRPEAASDLTYV